MIDARVYPLGRIEVPEPTFGDFALNVCPLDSIPNQFNIWCSAIRQITKFIPNVKKCMPFVTIDSKFFTKAGLLRREGVHVDGNFCVDPTFNGATWSEGGGKETWGGSKLVNGKPKMSWISPYNIEMPVGKYISNDLGGIFCISTQVGCRCWTGKFKGEVGNGGDVSHWKLNPEKGFILDKNTLYFMTSNTPHETLEIPAGVRRTLLRITLPHDYPNHLITALPHDYPNHLITDKLL